MRSPLVDLIGEAKLHGDGQSQWQWSRRRKKKKGRERESDRKKKKRQRGPKKVTQKKREKMER